MSGPRTTALLACTTLTLVALVPAAPAHALVRSLDPSDGGTNDRLGTSVALAGDTLVVGAPGQGTARGAVYVFTRGPGETWTQSAKLTASDGTDGDLLGAAVAITGDTVVAGAPGSANDQGAVYLFDRTGAAARTERARLAAADGAPNDALGQAVAADGATVVAGAPGDDLHGATYDANHGSVYTFAATATGAAAPTAKLTASDNTNLGYDFGGSALGSSVAIAGDTIVAGAPLDNFGQPTGTRRGSAYTFTATGTPTRSETAKLSLSGTAYGRLGVAVDLDGDTIVVTDDEADGARGIAYTFDRTGAATRTQTGTLRPANPTQNGGFGASVSMAGGFVVVGAPTTSGGAAFVFSATGAADRTETWRTAGADPNGGYGTAVGTDGDRVVGGAPLVDVSAPTFLQDRGRAYSSTPDLFTTTVGTGTGSVAVDPPGPHLLGDQVTLTATPGSGSFFAGWENFAGCSGTGACSFTLTGEPLVAARFTAGAPPADTTPPAVSITGGPAEGATLPSGDVSFAFTADEAATFTCAYDGAAPAPCTSPDTRTGLAAGAHTFAVRATDTAGNVSAPATRGFTVATPAPPPPADTTAPDTRITKAPPRTVRAKGRATVKVAFTGSEPGRFVCRVDGGPEQACTSPASFRLQRGRHTITVTAIDAAGNRDATPATVRVGVRRKRR